MKIATLFLLLCLSFSHNDVQAKDLLKACCDKQVPVDDDRYRAIIFHEKRNELYHSSEPWQQMTYDIAGTFWYNSKHFLKQDTLRSGQRTLYSKTSLKGNELLLMDYGSKALTPVTPQLLTEQLLESARYTPALLLQYFREHKVTATRRADTKIYTYTTLIGDIRVTLYINSLSERVDKIGILANDELRGDVLTSISYLGYTTDGLFCYPGQIRIERVNGKLVDEVNLSNYTVVLHPPQLLDAPEDYAVADKKDPVPEIKKARYAGHIYLLNMPHTGVRSLVVEFDSFLLVAEAPLNTINGELIIREARKIAPHKPIRYFTFGHHHPHYLGGLRAFVYAGATILGTPDDETYVRYLATAQHSLSPDSLQRKPRPLQYEIVRDSLLISDGNMSMMIYHIGEQSGHTRDYLVYYFPQEKMLYEGDLVWVRNNGPAVKAGPTQKGLYKAITALGIDVREVLQSWGTGFPDYKMDISFEDLKQSVTAP
ncbi:MAG: hypothetical protein EOP49_05045 [Sphingobacteriales bacterium]|nr:MAG: hypothetical protein EOP49_05045 [Sphingobacteriales bacterium]